MLVNITVASKQCLLLPAFTNGEIQSTLCITILDMTIFGYNQRPFENWFSPTSTNYT